MNRIYAALLVVFLFTVPSLAQVSTGNLVGTVSGPDGLIPGATVTITNNQTGGERTVVTGTDGGFRVPQLDVGTYTVKVTAQGFKTFTATNVEINVGREYSLSVPLEVGEIHEEVTVVGGADVINATTGELSNTVTERQIQELPLNGRNPIALITLQAGTASNSANVTHINGQRTSFTNITRDGINVQDNFIRSNATDFVPQRPNVDDVSEFTLTSQNAGAESGYGGAQVQLVTPRGTNEYHGALFEYNRNSKFAANSFFNNAAGTPRAFLNRNQFGFRVGGPMPTPRFGEGGPALDRDKGFFFIFYEGFRQRTQSGQNRTILLPNARQGIFTYIDNSGVIRQVNLLSPQFGGTLTLPVTAINPEIQSRILANVPAVGNNTNVGDQRNTTGFRFNQRSNTDRDNFTMRLDYDINPRNTLSGVYTWGRESNDRTDLSGGYTVEPLVVQPADRTFLSLAWRMTPTASFTNELRGGFFLSDPVFNRVPPQPAFRLGLPLISNPETGFEDQGRLTGTYALLDNATYLRGNHSIRFGGQAQFFRIESFASFNATPTYTIGTNTLTGALTAGLFPGGINSAQLGTANSLLALLGGLTTVATQEFNATSTTSGFVPGAASRQFLEFDHYSFYISDQWRAHPTLTLNFGLRYEYFTPMREANGFALEPVIGSRDPVEAILDPNGTVDFIGANGGGNNFWRPDKNNFAPVLSFAWSPQYQNRFLSRLLGESGRTVIRGGFRMSYVNDEFIRGPDNAQGGNQGLQSTRQFGIGQRVGQPGGLFVVPPPALSIPRPFSQGGILAGNNFGTVFAVHPNLQVPRTMEYSFGIQRELGFQTALEIRYVGARSNNLVRGVDYNEVNVRAGGFLEDFFRARSNVLLAQALNAQQAAAGVPAAQRVPITGAFNAAVPGSQVLTVYPNLPAGGLLNNATVINQLIAGNVADNAVLYFTNPGAFGTAASIAAGAFFLPNFNAGPADLLHNDARMRYNSLQVELRRRFSQGLYFQANYTFQKTLTDASGTGQTNFEPRIFNALPEIEYARAVYDQTHVFNFNAIYELPFGTGRRFFTGAGPWANRLLGGWQVTSIVRIGTEAPLSITDPRGTLNRAARSGTQTANTSLTKDQIKDLIGIFNTPCGVFFINPAVIDINLSDCSGSRRAANGFGSTPFPGQVFFNVPPGETGNMERYFINGPISIFWDFSVIKNVQITERTRLQFRAEAFNVMNRTNFALTGQNTALNINSTNFGRITQAFAPRIMQFALRFEF